MKKLKELNNVFNGPVFIFASGSSASEFPLKKYSDFPFIVVNGAVRKFIEEGVAPFAYVFSDESFIAKSLELVKEAIKITNYIFMPRELFEKYLSNDTSLSAFFYKIYFVNKMNRVDGVRQVPDWLFYIKSAFDKDLNFNYSFISNRKNKIGFSTNMQKGYFCIRTIPYIALQVSYYLGFDRVFLVGVDLKESSGRFYDRDNPLPTSLDKDYLQHIEPGFRYLSENIVSDGFKVYNLSTDSRISTDLIPKIRLEDVINIVNVKA